MAALSPQLMCFLYHGHTLCSDGFVFFAIFACASPIFFPKNYKLFSGFRLQTSKSVSSLAAIEL